MSAIGSGCSFGFFMGIGMVMRAEMEGVEEGDRELEAKLKGDAYNKEF
jgi:hypothetical protein